VQARLPERLKDPAGSQYASVRSSEPSKDPALLHGVKSGQRLLNVERAVVLASTRRQHRWLPRVHSLVWWNIRDVNPLSVGLVFPVRA